MASHTSDSCEGNSVEPENYFAVSFVEQRPGTLQTCRMEMSLLKGVKGKQGDSCALREGAAPAWCEVGLVPWQRCLPSLFPHICPTARPAFSWAVHFWSQENQGRERKGGKKSQSCTRQCSHHYHHHSSTMREQRHKGGMWKQWRRGNELGVWESQPAGKDKILPVVAKGSAKSSIWRSRDWKKWKWNQLPADSNGEHRKQAYCYPSALSL